MKALNPLEILIYPQGFETMKCFKDLRLLQITFEKLYLSFYLYQEVSVQCESEVSESQVIQVHKSQKISRTLRSVGHR